MAIVEKSRKPKRDAKKGVDSKKEEAILAVLDRMKRARKIAGRRRPQRRGTVFNGIVKDVVKGCAGTFKNLIPKAEGGELKVPFSQQSTAGRRAGKKHQAVPAQPSADARPFTSPSLALVKEPKQRSSLVESPVNHISVAGKIPWTTSSIDTDSAIPFPTKSVVMAKLWAEVDVTNALAHDGSVLFEEENGKWTAMELCPDDAAENVPPSTNPVVQIAAALC